MATANYYLQSKKNPAVIYVRLRDGKTIDAKAKTNLVVDPDEWSAAKGQPKSNKEEGLKLLTTKLDKLKGRLFDAYNKRELQDKIDSNWLKTFINPPEVIEGVPTKLIEYIDYFILHKKNVVGSSTYKRNRVYKALIERFQMAMGRDYYIRDVDADFQLNFEKYCDEQNYAHNTIARTLKFIKTICFHARKNRVEVHFQMENIKVKLTKVNKVYLTLEEIKKIENKVYASDYHDNARDWLIISCETGQRVSDFMRFRKGQIRYESEVPLIEFTQLKTNKKMAIPLSKKVLGILQKRKGEFPRQISDQRYNEYIKEVAKLAGITSKTEGSKMNNKTNRKVTGVFPKYQLVASHIGRRSFATNNFGKIPTALLCYITGHSTEKMFLEYIGKTETENAIQFAKYF
ncbi:MAG: tyrosine-type recombinase/integrase [Bacteroidia bacterium]|nr:tyrosine-type recombinase/integrase [Bacteroidota bacterium]MBP6412065.1 tyrosine-type recombinase/integrase [Bacteroidia bacterium]